MTYVRVFDIEKKFAIVREKTESQQKLPISIAFQSTDNHFSWGEQSVQNENNADGS